MILTFMEAGASAVSSLAKRFYDLLRAFRERPAALGFRKSLVGSPQSSNRLYASRIAQKPQNSQNRAAEGLESVRRPRELAVGTNPPLRCPKFGCRHHQSSVSFAIAMLRTAARPLSRGASLVTQYDRKVAAGTLIKDSTQREALRRLERLRQELLAHGSAMVEYQHAVCHTGLEPRAGVLLTGLLIMLCYSPWIGHSVERQRGCHHARAGEAGAGGD